MDFAQSECQSLGIQQLVLILIIVPHLRNWKLQALVRILEAAIKALRCHRDTLLDHS